MSELMNPEHRHWREFKWLLTRIVFPDVRADSNCDEDLSLSRLVLSNMDGIVLSNMDGIDVEGSLECFRSGRFGEAHCDCQVLMEIDGARMLRSLCFLCRHRHKVP